jgi:hypothetical protein
MDVHCNYAFLSVIINFLENYKKKKKKKKISVVPCCTLR